MIYLPSLHQHYHAWTDRPSRIHNITPITSGATDYVAYVLRLLRVQTWKGGQNPLPWRIEFEHLTPISKTLGKNTHYQDDLLHLGVYGRGSSPESILLGFMERMLRRGASLSKKTSLFFQTHDRYDAPYPNFGTCLAGHFEMAT